MNLKIKINREIDLKDQIQEQLEEFRNKTIKNNERIGRFWLLSRADRKI